MLLRVSSSSLPESEPQPKRRRLSDVSATTVEDASRLYGAELVVYDRHSRCLLIDGDYELVMKEINSSETNGTSPNPPSEKSPRNKGNASWSTLDSTNTAPLSILTLGPMLKFRLEWANDPIPALVDRYVKYLELNYGVLILSNTQTKAIRCGSVDAN